MPSKETEIVAATLRRALAVYPVMAERVLSNAHVFDLPTPKGRKAPVTVTVADPDDGMDRP